MEGIWRKNRGTRVPLFKVQSSLSPTEPTLVCAKGVAGDDRSSMESCGDVPVDKEEKKNEGKIGEKREKQ